MSSTTLLFWHLYKNQSGTAWTMYHHQIIRFLINVQVQGQHPYPLPGSWLAARIADLIQDLKVCLSWELPLCNSSVICVHVILGLPGPCFPSTCIAKALSTAPLKGSICPYQRSLFSFRMRSRYSIQTCTSNSLDLVVTISCGLTLQICLIIALSIRCTHWRFGFVNGQVLLAWSIVLYTQHLYTWPFVLRVVGKKNQYQLLELLPGGFHTCCGSKFTAIGCWKQVSR